MRIRPRPVRLTPAGHRSTARLATGSLLAMAPGAVLAVGTAVVRVVMAVVRVLYLLDLTKARAPRVPMMDVLRGLS
jgi:hypothetical protein